MTSFKFPPPPPPPPKAPSNDAQNTYNSQRGGHDTGRGDRGRGRGGQHRGRGNPEGNPRGAFGQGDRAGSAQSRGGSRGGYQQSGRGGWQNQNQNYARGPPQQHVQQPSAQITPQFNANPPPLASPPLSGVLAPQVNPDTLVQAMSFMSTPAGMQSMAAFANHMAGASTASAYAQAPSQQRSPQSHQSPPPIGSAKRKRDERAMQWQSPQKQQAPRSTQQGGQKPLRAKAVTAPALPSFGFSLSSAPKPQPTSDSTRIGDQKRRKVNMGLTRHENQEEEGSESDAEVDDDEEAAFASNEKLKNGVVFEHGGESISLQTPAEIAAWIKDRKRQFPTQKRVAEKAQEAAEKRAKELDFLRKITGKPGRRDPDPGEQAVSKPQRNRPERRPLPAKSDADIDRLRKRVEQSMSTKDTAQSRPRAGQTPAAAVAARPAAVDLGLGYASETESDHVDSSDLSDSSVLSDSEDLSSNSSSSDDNDDENAPPETTSSKLAIAPVAAPPPPPPKQTKQQQKRNDPDVCPQWKKTRRCKYGKHCRYPHPAKDEPKLVGLYDRLVEQELEKGDRLALDAIKFLGSNGFLG